MRLMRDERGKREERERKGARASVREGGEWEEGEGGGERETNLFNSWTFGLGY
jgi:hypothetical protein